MKDKIEVVAFEMQTIPFGKTRFIFRSLSISSVIY